MKPEQNMLGRLLTLKKMIKAGKYNDCVALTIKLRYDLAKFSDVSLRDKIKDNILAIENMIGQKKTKEDIMKDLDKEAKLLISILLKSGIK